MPTSKQLRPKLKLKSRSYMRHVLDGDDSLLQLLGHVGPHLELDLSLLRRRGLHEMVL